MNQSTAAPVTYGVSTGMDGSGVATDAVSMRVCTVRALGAARLSHIAALIKLRTDDVRKCLAKHGNTDGDAA